jgi:hypothetical protein
MARRTKREREAADLMERVEALYGVLAPEGEKRAVAIWFADEIGYHFTSVYRWLRGEMEMPKKARVALEALEYRALRTEDEDGRQEGSREGSSSARG